MEPLILKEYLECQCLSKEHMIVFEYDSDIGLMVYVQMHNFRGFFKRIAAAMKYIFKIHRGGDYCRWDDCLVLPEDVKRIKKLLDEVK